MMSGYRRKTIDFMLSPFVFQTDVSVCFHYLSPKLYSRKCPLCVTQTVHYSSAKLSLLTYPLFVVQTEAARRVNPLSEYKSAIGSHHLSPKLKLLTVCFQCLRPTSS